MTIQAPFQSLDYGFLMEDVHQTFQFQHQAPQQPMMVAMVQEPSLPAEQMLGSLIDKQSKEIDRYVQQQNNVMRMNIQQQCRQNLASLVRTLESRAALIMRGKDEELAMVENRILQLESCLRGLEQDRGAWESAARESEAVAVSLSNALERLQSPCLSSTGGAGEDGGEEMTSSAKAKGGGRTGSCRMCGVRDSCMLLLPCRHLCTCELCDASLGACPVCELAKDASVEVFLA